MMESFLYSLLFPANILILFATMATIFWLMRWRKLALFALITGLSWVFLWSLPVTTLIAGGYLEQRYPQRPAHEYPRVDAIVVLGGHIQGNRHNWFEEFDRSLVVSRESIAADLYKAQRADLILLSGGALKGSVSDTASMSRSLQMMGIPAESILQETQSQNTLENARLTDQTLRNLERQQILLVTSALHMPRAMTAFEGRPMIVTPASLPPQIKWPPSNQTPVWIPNLHTLLASQSIIKEYVGLILYWVQAVL